MRTFIETLIVSGTLLLSPAPAWPAEYGAEVGTAYPEPAAPAGELGADPTQPLPPPPDTLPPPPPAQAQAPAPQAAPAGQWVYTAQYGWVWMPYGDAYTYVPPSGYGEPYEFVYAPVYGWTWVVAPWVWGWGPWPHFGTFGPGRFAWFGHGWWRNPGRFHLAPAFHRGGFVNRGVAVTPFRGGNGGGFVGSRGGHVGSRGGHVGGGQRGGGGRRGGGGHGGGHR